MTDLNRVRLPYFWRQMSFTAKAAHLVVIGVARDFNAACSLLARMPRKPRATQIRKELGKFWWNKAD